MQRTQRDQIEDLRDPVRSDVDRTLRGIAGDACYRGDLKKAQRILKVMRRLQRLECDIAKIREDLEPTQQ